MTQTCNCRHGSLAPNETAVKTVHAEHTVGEVVQRDADALEIMKQLGINHCCGAHLTLREAAAAAGVSLEALLAKLNEPRPTLSPGGPGEMPGTLARVPEGRRVLLDVRDDIRRGEEPFTRIMTAVRELEGDQALVLRVPFEPIPLYDVLGKRGFQHWTERRAADDWSVTFYRESRPSPAPAAPTASQGRVIDVRGLEPPQPMLEVLDAIDRLESGVELEVRHDRRPTLLYPLLDERGYVHDTDEPEPGLVRIRIRRSEV